jgi:hypothetical protein
MTSAQLAEARTAGATVCEPWQIRTAQPGEMQVYLSTAGWWGIAKIGERGRIARRRSIAAAVRLAARH